jgi:dTDP-4-amino-4,6-dideoxygalactose transaminase
VERKIEKILAFIPAFILQALKHIFIRTHFVDYDFFSGTTSWRDCISILWSVLKREALQDGPYISAYEKMVAEYHGVRYTFSFAAGRMALYSILEAIDVGKGDEVILPAYSCVVCPNAILYRGAIPVYVDINPETFNIDPKKIEAKITPRTKAIMAQHTFGLPCDLDEVIEIAQRHGITVIEDCAHAVGADYKGKKVGSIAHVGFFSTDHTKMLSTSTGGMVITDDEELASRIKHVYLRTPFLPKRMIGKILFTFIAENFLYHPNFYFIGKWLVNLCWILKIFHFFLDEGKIEKPTEYPYPARLSNIQAKVGIRQMNELEQNIAHRREIAHQYDSIFGLYQQQFDGSQVDRKHVFLRYSFLISDHTAFKKQFSKYMHLGEWFNSIAIGRNKDFHEIYYQDGECPIGEMVAYHSANFPTHNKIRNPKLILKFANGIVKSNALILPSNLTKENFRMAKFGGD